MLRPTERANTEQMAGTDKNSETNENSWDLPEELRPSRRLGGGGDQNSGTNQNSDANKESWDLPEERH